MATMCKAAVDLVASRDLMDLEVRGDILICEGRSWSRRTAIYVPAECFHVDRSQRRDGRTLIRGFLAPAFVVALTVLLGAGCYLAAYFGVAFPLEATVTALREGMLLALAPAFLYTALCVGRFARLQDTIRVEILGAEGATRLEFWHRPGLDPAVDRLVRRLFELSLEHGHATAFPLKTGYAWQHRRPLRALIATGARGMAAMYVLAILARLFLRWYTGEAIVVTPMFFTIFLLPWVWGGGKYLLGQFFLTSEPLDFRLGLKLYHNEQFDQAEAHFRAVLTTHPDHVPSLFFLAQHYMQRFDFDRAFQYCTRLLTLAPEIGESMQEDIWALKRVAGRMERDSGGL
jgi:hypothetical protein